MGVIQVRRASVLILLVGLGVSCMGGTSFAATRIFDMGTADSSVWEGGTRVTAQSVYSAASGFGWERPDGLKEQVRVWDQPGERSGNPAPPQMWSNAITEDCIIGEGANRFLVDLPDGSYHVYLLAGISEDSRNQVWAFNVTAQQGAAPKLVEMEGGFQLRAPAPGRPCRRRTAGSRPGAAQQVGGERDHHL